MNRPDIPGYNLVRPLSETGSGSVFLARNKNNKEVAVKLTAVDSSTGATTLRRFERGLRLARTLSHPNLVPVLDGGVAGSHTWVASELVEAIDLEDYLAKHDRVELSKILTILRKVCRAVGHMHEIKMTHRDLRPANILICRGGEVMVTGFGAVKRFEADDSFTSVGQVIADPHYMSPEQCLCAKRIDHRSDIYSLGCVLYHCLTGTPPYEHKDSFQVILGHVKKPVPSVGAACPRCPNPLAKLTGKMMAKKAMARMPTMKQVYRVMSDRGLLSMAARIQV